MNYQHKISKLGDCSDVRRHLISASRLVMATPTVDSAADVTCPAWERLVRVLRHLHGG